MNSIQSLINILQKSSLSKIHQIVIISPFIAKGFVEKLLENLSPDELFIIVDKASELKLDEINNLENKAIHTRLSQIDNGIVHAKLFLFTAQNLEVDSKEHLFLWGSCNATDAAFNKNSESLSWFKFQDKENKELLEYFRSACNNEDGQEVNEIDLQLNGINLQLPKFKLVKQGDSFDKWLENGVLFDPDKTSLPKHLSIPLKKDIGIEKEANDCGFGLTENKALKFEIPYSQNSKLIDIKHYSLKVMYGLWLPKPIAEAEHYKYDGQVISEFISELEKGKHDLIEDSIVKFKAFIEKLRAKDTKLKEYFDDNLINSDNTIKEESFKELLTEDLQKHLLNCKRLKNKPFVVHPLPPIRFNQNLWIEFVKSFASSLCEEIKTPQGPGKKLSKAMKECITSREETNHLDNTLIPKSYWKSEDFNLENTISHLRKLNWDKQNWDGKTIGECITESLNQKLEEDIKQSDEK
jgi:hypothetical protein